MQLDDYLREQLAQRKKAGLYRTRTCIQQNHEKVLSTQDGHYLDFASNDYLGLGSHPQVMQSWAEGLALYGNGSGASPLVSGYMQAHQSLETRIATSLNREAAVLFSSGFAANQALCGALFAGEHKGGTLISDKFMHASFIDGAIASSARFKRFAHNDCNHLESLLAAADQTGPLLVATEGVFSMDGDSPDMDSLVALTQQYNAWLMIDDAHGLGVLGPEHGLGSVEQWGLTERQTPVVMGTFGKSLGTSGAFICGSQLLIDYLINFARDYIYSTALPPSQACATETAWQIMCEGSLTSQLHANIAYFREVAELQGIPLSQSNSAIQLVQIGNAEKTVQLSEKLKTLGIWVGAMRSPTVPKGTDRLRITLSASHSKKDINALVDALQLVLTSSVQESPCGTYP